MAAGKTAAERLRTAAEGGPGGSGEALDPAPYRQRFIDAMEDDLNTSSALSILFDLVRDLNRGRDEGHNVADAVSTLRELAAVLGLRLEAAAQDSMAAAPFIDLLLELRKELREAKQYALADRIRNGLSDLDILLEDSAAGTTWKQK